MFLFLQPTHQMILGCLIQPKRRNLIQPERRNLSPDQQEQKRMCVVLQDFSVQHFEISPIFLFTKYIFVVNDAYFLTRAQLVRKN